MFNVINNDPKLKEAAEIAEKVLHDPSFIKEIREKNKFTYTPDSSEEVAEVIEANLNLKINVLTYKTWSPWSAVIGYSDGEDIYVNTRKLPYLSVSDYVGNFIHEFCHHIGYGHGNNKPNGKEHSVPYWVGNLAQEYAEKYLSEHGRN